MDDSPFFNYVDTAKLVELIDNAQESVIYAAPGLREEVSYALITASERCRSGVVAVWSSCVLMSVNRVFAWDSVILARYNN